MTRLTQEDQRRLRPECAIFLRMLGYHAPGAGRSTILYRRCA
jgi:hypothetical protein